MSPKSLSSRPSTTSATDGLAEARAAAVAANAAVRSVERDRQAAEHDAEALRAGMVEAFARGDEAGADTLTADLAKNEADARVSAARLDGARLAAHRATQAIGAFAAGYL